MPFMQPQIQGIDLAEREKEHEKNEPRQRRSQRKKISIPHRSDEHREPKGGRIEECTKGQCTMYEGFFHFLIYSFI